MQSQHKPQHAARKGGPQQPQQTPAQSVRPAGAARLLGIGESTLWRWVKGRDREGFPQPIRLGPKTTVFDVPALIAFRDAQAGK